MRGVIKSMRKNIKSMHKNIKSMRKIIESMREDLKSMREDLKSMRKVFQSEYAKFFKSMRKVNARKFKIDVQGHGPKFESNAKMSFWGLEATSTLKTSRIDD